MRILLFYQVRVYFDVTVGSDEGGIEIDSIDEAREQGWIPYFYEGDKEHEFACPGCSEVFSQSGEDKEMEVKEEYQ